MHLTYKFKVVSSWYVVNVELISELSKLENWEGINIMTKTMLICFHLRFYLLLS
jgi:hypothetical protein